MATKISSFVTRGKESGSLKTLKATVTPILFTTVRFQCLTLHKVITTPLTGVTVVQCSVVLPLSLTRTETMILTLYWDTTKKVYYFTTTRGQLLSLRGLLFHNVLLTMWLAAHQVIRFMEVPPLISTSYLQ